MGVDISFYKTSKKVFDKIYQDFKDDKDIDWDFLQQYEICYGRGRHFLYNFLVDNFGSTPIKEFSEENIKDLKEQADSAVNKWTVEYEEIYQIPVKLLEKYLEEAKKNNEEYIILPLEDCNINPEFLDDSDYYQCEEILKTDWSKNDDEVIWFSHSW